MSAWPLNHAGSGGMVNLASPASMPTTASTSARSEALTKASTSSRRPDSPSERRTACWLTGFGRPSSVRRARCSALLTDATVVSSHPATSAAGNPRTSRSITTARCVAGSFCSVATKASSTLSSCS
jgi:hypothetical protein